MHRKLNQGIRSMTTPSLFDSKQRFEEYFPSKYKPNDSQKHILAELNKAVFEQGKKFIIMNAPTGTGKSLIAKTLANWSNDPTEEFCAFVDDYSIYSLDSPPDDMRFGCAVLTISKQLQDQYAKLFKDGSKLMGKGNYPCEINDDLTCDAGACFFNKKQTKKCQKSGTCPYYNQRNETAVNKCAFYNYALFHGLPDAIKAKDVLVCDEASELEDELVNIYTFNFNIKEFQKLDLPYPSTPNEKASNGKHYAWLTSVQNLILEESAKMKRELKEKMTGGKRKKKLTKDEKTRMTALLKYKETLAKVLEVWNKAEFVITHTKDGIVFQPTEVYALSNSFFSCANLVVLMSATIVDHKEFARTLGIDDYYYIEALSTFDPKKAPIHFAANFKINHENKNKVLPEIVEVVGAICQQHSNQKGIIHTHSMDILEYIRAGKFSQERFLYRGEGGTNQSLLDYHKSTDQPTILVSPSMTHGVDLVGKLGEFQIIMKAPFLPLGDARIKKKFERDRTWYTNKMLSTLIQMCGRCNRNEKDVSVTYVMDSTIRAFVSRNKDKLPKYFTDRFV